ncbi:deoxyribose-phosphate aldolase [Autumnicola psychrophila]|uniref:Deoxyribose-phosphate aldolase n=1 Tax=Autumnicola psychrophila TaxID=3075592 RepID=A0ABU3DUP4_9FLAO|nr:deoxyribose-phosphate aldolase [Zunongwangia sp. F225]MDT0687424.1 deoxyribose-phosphate aldolase [Zunongwangia sp. F225]
MQLNKFIDHTNLKPTATPGDIKKLCSEAIAHQFYAICINSCYVKLAYEELKTSEIKLAAVVGFPLGAMDMNSKVFEAEQCIANGADEIDMVINIGQLKAGNIELVENEIALIKKAIGRKILKVIIETCYLSEEEKIAACECALRAKANFVKTSTGFGTSGASFDDVKLMKSVVKEELQIKASGGIKDTETAEKYIKMGVARLGTSSGISIIQ